MMSENRASIRQGLLPDKICSTHRDRLAIVYIRQSTPQQIERHQESTRLQYALVERAVHFGWPRERVVVIDDDLGRTGKTIEGRLGFQRLVAEVSLGNVGLVLGIEMMIPIEVGHAFRREAGHCSGMKPASIPR